MKKFKLTIWLLTVLLMSLMLFSCGGSDENLKQDLIGSWSLTSDSEDAFSDEYPGSRLTFKENGRFENGGMYGRGNYYIEDGIIVINTNNWFSEREYKISIESGLLKLQYKGYAPVYYQRID